MNIDRRDFLKSGGVLMAGLGTASFSKLGDLEEDKLKRMKTAVKFTRDGLDLTPLESIMLLQELEGMGRIEVDSYSLGGIVADLEKKFSVLLGKEAAIFMPTGTMANHIAIRKLAGERRRVIVQAESHIYRDSGDCAQNLSNLNLIPLGHERVDFSLQDVKDAVTRTKQDRVKTGIGAISIESPVRRKNNQLFSFDEMKKVVDFAREEKLGLHLDGARLFNASVHSNISPDEYAAMFDTVYISLYKNFNAPSGAILAGDKDFIDGLYHTRRMFGGGLPQVWPYAAIAAHYADSFLVDYEQAVRNAESFFVLIEKNSRLKIERIDAGTNVFILKVADIPADKFRQRLAEQNIFIPGTRPGSNEFTMKINPTINRISTGLLAEKFITAVS